MKSTATDDPEILLCASDEETMHQWLEAIAQESMRTDDFVAPDWWTETFGSVSLKLCLDSGLSELCFHVMLSLGSRDGCKVN